MNRYTETQIIWPMKEAMKLALDALARPDDTIASMYCYYMGDIDDLRAALRQAISEAERKK